MQTRQNGKHEEVYVYLILLCIVNVWRKMGANYPVSYQEKIFISLWKVVSDILRVLSWREGPSGSGKTTLLDLLAGRKTPSYGKQEGDIVVDGVRRIQGADINNNIGSGTAYVMQVRGHFVSFFLRVALNRFNWTGGAGGGTWAQAPHF